MAVSPAELAAAVRLGDGVTDPAEPLAGVLRRLLAAAEAIVEQVCPQAPDAVKDLAIVQLCAYLYDKDPTLGGRLENALTNSGARGLLSLWCPRDAVVIGD